MLRFPVNYASERGGPIRSMSQSRYNKEGFHSVVKMAWWTAFTHADLLEEEQAAIGVLRDNFIRHHIGAGDGPRCVQPIHTVLNPPRPDDCGARCTPGRGVEYPRL